MEWGRVVERAGLPADTPQSSAFASSRRARPGQRVQRFYWHARRGGGGADQPNRPTPGPSSGELQTLSPQTASCCKTRGAVEVGSA